MKREGRQHGMVMSYMIIPPPFNPNPNYKVVHKFDSRPTAGSFMKVSSKPTNHSKFSGDCNSHLKSKSKDKAKGTQKFKSCNEAMNHQSLAWRVVDNGNGLIYHGKSATGILSHISSEFVDDYGDEVEEYDGDVAYEMAEDVTDMPRGNGFVRNDQEEEEEDESWCVL